MRARVGIVLGMAFFVGTPTASAGDCFQYRDLATGCDLVVDRRRRDPAQEPRRCASATRGRAGGGARQSRKRACERAAVRLGAGGALGIDVGPKAIEAKLARNGGRYLTESELADLKRLSSPRVSAFVLAALAALVAWIAVMVAAFREDHLGWAMLMLFLSAPMAFIYLFTTLGKGHGRFKAVCALGMLSPLLVFLANVWLALGGAHG